MSTTDPHWLRIARADIGLRELPGSPTSPKIRQWLADLGAWWRDDETPWCGTAVAAWMRQAGFELPKHWYRAKGWLEFGRHLDVPALGAVVVFERAGGGHVGLAVGRDRVGRLMVLGGNQGNAVSIAPFDMARVIGYRWPNGEPLPSVGLSTYTSSGPASTNEA